MKFHERLRIAMENSGLRAGELASATGIDKTNISHLLAGQRGPGIDTLATLLRAMPDVNARWLVTGEKT